MTIDLATAAIILSLLTFVWSLIKERHKPKLDQSQSNELEERIRASLEKSLLAENERLVKRIELLEEELKTERENNKKLILDLQTRDAQRESSMQVLRKQLLDLEDANCRLIKEREEWNQEYLECKNERKEWEKGVGLLIRQMSEARINPQWYPPGIQVQEIKSGFGKK